MLFLYLNTLPSAIFFSLLPTLRNREVSWVPPCAMSYSKMVRKFSKIHYYNKNVLKAIFWTQGLMSHSIKCYKIRGLRKTLIDIVV